jgi:hypothetical protein
MMRVRLKQLLTEKTLSGGESERYAAKPKKTEQRDEGAKGENVTKLTNNTNIIIISSIQSLS